MRLARFLLALLLAAAHVGAAELTLLKADGPVLRDDAGRGKPVLLRGANVGGWLVFEAWMTPMDRSGLKDAWSARRVLRERFGEKIAGELLGVYEEAWFGADDLDRIKALGLNAIRVPFADFNLIGDDGAWRADAFARLDWVVAEAGRRGLYVILDLHGAPGGQSTDGSTGRVRERAELWHDPEARRRTVEIWRRVAERYRGNPIVAMYDLLNEPTGAPSRAALWAFYDELYRAVRAVDPDHAVSMETCWSGAGGHWSLDVLPPPGRFGWTNVVYQNHAYEWAWDDAAKQREQIAAQERDVAAHAGWRVPVLIGEFNVMAPKPDPAAVWREALRRYEAAGASWCVWSYKSARGRGDDSWGLFNPTIEPDELRPDLQRDSAEEIRAKWARVGTAESFARNPMIPIGE